MLDSRTVGSPDSRFGFTPDMKTRLFLLLLASAPLAVAQTPDQAQSAPLTGPTILSRTELDVPPEVATGRAGNYFNFMIYGDYTYNSYEPFTGTSTSSVGLSGYDGGIGLNLLHYLRDGALTVNYTGGYRGYSGLNDDPADNIIQNFSLGFNKQISKHVLFSFHQIASIYPGGWLPQQISTPSSVIGVNNIAARSETIASSVTVTLLQTRRLSWVIGGDFFDLTYKPSTQIGSVGADGNFGFNYRLTRKTTFGATAIGQYYSFRGANGSTASEGANVSLSHLFSPRVQAGLTAGVQRSSYSALSAQIIGNTLLISNGQHTAYNPTFSGRLSVVRKRVTFSLLGGQSAGGGGNGQYLASKVINGSGSFSYVATRSWSFSLGGGYQLFTSLAGGPATPSEFGSAGVNYKLTAHFGFRATGSYSKYSTIGTYAGNSYYNAMVGIIYTSADRPVASIF